MNKATYVTGIIVAAVLGTYFGLFGSLALDWMLPYNINSTNPFNGLREFAPNLIFSAAGAWVGIAFYKIACKS
ncbi:hypothetical protein N8912_04160 [Rhodobacteraceae bacterium]|jgi:hypothetical protein|nr:hypothetical protein [Paracoccaceae bacterium]